MFIDKKSTFIEISWDALIAIVLFSQHLKREDIMNKLVIILSFATILILPGCIVKALHPFYLEKDLVFEPQYVGSWYDPDSSLWEIKQHTFKKYFLGPDSLDKSYYITYSESDKNIRNEFRAHLFKLGNNYYFDFYPVINDKKDSDLYISHLIKSHSIAKAEIEGDSLLQIKWMNEKWLQEMFEQKRIKISHEVLQERRGYSSYVLTATTEELQ